MVNSRTIFSDLFSGIVLFFIGLPLALGIAFASGAPVYSGVISSLIGGTIVLFLSNNNKIVTGPAAGLSTIVYVAITKFDSFDSFLLVVLIAGLIQIFFGILKFGDFIRTIPEVITKGLLVAVGIILILKQLPHLLGNSPEGPSINKGSVIISFLLLILFLTLNKLLNDSKLGIILFCCICVGLIFTAFSNSSFNFFSIPLSQRLDILIQGEFKIFFLWNAKFSSIDFYIIGINAFTLAMVSSIESLLCFKAMEFLEKGESNNVNPNRELMALGVGNLFCGLLGGLPLSAVVVRSALNYYNGVKTKLSTLTHVVLLIISMVFLKYYLNYIPLCIPAFVLICLGYKMSNPQTFLSLYKKQNYRELLLFIITIISIVLSDLLTGIALSLAVFTGGIIYDIFISSEISLPQIVSKSKIILSQQKKSLIVIGSGLLTYIVSESKFFEYDRNFINNLNVYAVVLAIAVFYFWEKQN